MSGVKFTSYIDAHLKKVREDNLADVKLAVEVVEAELEHVRMDNEKDIRDLVRRIEKLEKGGVSPNTSACTKNG